MERIGGDEEEKGEKESWGGEMGGRLRGEEGIEEIIGEKGGGQRGVTRRGREEDEERENQCWVGATFFSSHICDMLHFLNLCTTAPLFQQKISRHHISAITLAPPRHILGNIRAITNYLYVQQIIIFIYSIKKLCH